MPWRRSAKAFQLSPSPNHRNLLRHVLFEALQADFARYRHSAEEIERLLDEPKQQATYLRLTAAGMENAGELRAAPGSLSPTDRVLDGKQRELDRLDKAHWVRRERWIQVRLNGLREAAPPEMRAEIDRVVRERLDSASHEGTPRALSRFLDYFGGQPLADQVAAAIGRPKYRQSKHLLLQAELVLRTVQQSADRAQAVTATVQLAEMLREAGLSQDAATCYMRLAGELAKVAGADGKTGQQVVEALDAGDPVKRWLRPSAAWPTGAVAISKERQRVAAPPSYISPVVQYLEHETRGPFFSDLSIEFDQNAQKLVARDGWGNKRWRCPPANCSGRSGIR